MSAPAIDLRAPFILPEDVLLVPVTELAPRVRAALDCGPDDVTLSRPGHRAPSRVISAPLAELLAEFREPTPLTGAILRYSRRRHLSPEETLEAAFGALQQFCNQRLLVPASEAPTPGLTAGLAVGQQVGAYEILQPVQVLEDTELYRARGPGGKQVAIKRLRPGVSADRRRQLERERLALEHLDGRGAPRLVEGWEAEGACFLVLDWCEGEALPLRAAALRALPPEEGRPRLHRIGCRLLAAYAALHRKGLLHGDVHPGNLLVDGDDEVTPIDFGLAVATATGPALPPAARAGVAFYFEPEIARALLAGRPAPPATAAGEQYAVAVLLYLLLTGEHYLPVAYDRERLLTGILCEPPLPFTRLALPPWPAVERVLARALSKEPADRYPDMTDFLAAFDAAGQEAASPARPAGDRAAARLAEMASRLQAGGELFERGLPEPPAHSVAFGSGGIALFLLRLARRRESPELLALADVWACRAAATMDAPGAFLAPELGLTTATVERHSPWFGPPGVHLVRAQVAHARGDSGELAAAVRAFLDGVEGAGDDPELLQGRAGRLLVAARLLTTVDGMPRFDPAPLDQFVTTQFRMLGEEMAGWAATGGPPRLGIAHGQAGICYALLAAARGRGLPLPAGLPHALERLAAAAIEGGHGLDWPINWPPGDGPARSCAPGWCRGAAGFVHLWVLAHDQYGAPRYLELATGAARSAWLHPDRSNADLCCGLAGRAYALLRLYRHTGESRWLERARVLADQAAGAPLCVPRPHALLRGHLGVAMLALDLEQPERAVMPLFEL